MELASASRRVCSHPVLVGAVAGLLAGLAGLLWLSADGLSYGGAMLGAVVGGATAAYLAERDLRGDVRCALAADVLSSVLFFVGTVGWLVLGESTGSLSGGDLLLVAGAYALFGTIVAVPIGLLSLCIAGVAGALTSIAFGRGSDGNSTVGSARK